LLGITIVQGWAYIHDNDDKWPMRTFVRSTIDLLLHISLSAAIPQVIVLM
jgi:hypothetical protein